MGQQRTFIKGALYELEIDSLIDDPDQPRKFYDQSALKELENSIRSRGVLQPILFTKDSDSRILVVAGSRRCKAARDAGLKKIPGIFVEGNSAEIALMENLLRENLSAIEEAEGLGVLMLKHGYSQEQIAQSLGKARSTVSEILSLNKLPEAIRDECRQNPMYPRRVLVEIAKEPNHDSMLKLYEQCKRRKLTGDSVRMISRKKREVSFSINQIAALVRSTTQKLSYLEDARLLNSEITFWTELHNLGELIHRILEQQSFRRADTIVSDNMN
ncbi:MAG: ParB/RepB/Spo0J family partition protein [Syntrophobacteraceae bacterium]